MVLFHDRLTVDGKARITPQGYLVASARVGRADNIQDYRACELGLTDRAPDDIVRVFRPASEVFAVDSLRTAARLPVTMDHPNSPATGGMVDATNWREFAKGETGEEIMRDGDFIRVPFRITDAAAVQSVQADRQEFSLGYGADLRLEAGVHDGQPYDASICNLRYNHLAACRIARGGSELRIVDERPITAKGDTAVPKTIMVDGLSVNLEDATSTEAAITKLRTDRDTAIAARDAFDTDLKAANVTIAARDAEVVTLKDQVAAAKLTPQQLRDASASYARISQLAKAVGVTATDAMDEPAIRRAVVDAKMGDRAKGYSDDQVTAAFDALTAGVKVGDAPATVTDALATFQQQQGGPVNLGDAATAATDARKGRMDRFANAYRGDAANGK